MLDECQGLLQEGNLSRYSGPLCVCVPSVRCICLPVGGALPQDGLPLLAVSPLITHPHTPPLSVSSCYGAPCLVSLLHTDPPSSPIIRCAILTRPSSPSPAWGGYGAPPLVAVGIFLVDVPSKPASLPLVFSYCFCVVRLLADQIGRPTLDTNLLGHEGTGAATQSEPNKQLYLTSRSDLNKKGGVSRLINAGGGEGLLLQSRLPPVVFQCVNHGSTVSYRAVTGSSCKHRVCCAVCEWVALAAFGRGGGLFCSRRADVRRVSV